MNNPGTQTLRTPRLTLRRFTMEDVDPMFDNWANDDAVTRYLMWDSHGDREVTRVLLETWVAQYAEDGVYNWAIEYEGAAIGGISVVSGSEKDEWAEIGYCMGKAWWGQGLMTEALQAVLRFLFEQVQLHRVYLRHDAENIGSGRVMLKNGLVHEGTLRKHHKRKDGSFADMCLYGLLRDEWLAHEAAAEG